MACEFINDPNNSPCDLESTDLESMCNFCLCNVNRWFIVYENFGTEDAIDTPAIIDSNDPDSRYAHNKFKTWKEAIDYVRLWLGSGYFNRIDPNTIRPNTKMLWAPSATTRSNRYMIVRDR
jgi:hypothetical protein